MTCLGSPSALRRCARLTNPRRLGVHVFLVLVSQGVILPAAGTSALPEVAGIIVEATADKSPLSAAGVRPGDTLLSWSLGSTSVGGQGLTLKKIESPFHWAWLETEQAPRGKLTLRGTRSGTEAAFTLDLGAWGSEVRPPLHDSELAQYIEGKQFLENGQLADGLEAWRTLASAASEDDPTLACWLLYRIGNTLEAAGEWAEAETALVAALDLATGDDFANLLVRRELGDLYTSMNDFDRAAKLYQSVATLEEENHSLTLAWAQAKLGVLAWRGRKQDLAKEHWTTAMEIREKLAPGSLPFAASLDHLGALAYSQGDLKTAGDYYSKAFDIRRLIGPGSRELAASYSNVGLIAHALGDLQLAEEHYGDAMKLLEEVAESPLDIALLANNLAGVKWALGDLRAAQDNLLKAVEIRETLAPDSPDLAVSLANLAAISGDRGDLEMAGHYVDRAISIQERLGGSQPDLASSYLSRGTFAMDQADYGTARVYLLRALEIYETAAPEGLEIAAVLSNLGSLALLQNENDRAVEYMERALSLYEQKAPDRAEVAVTFTNLGYAHALAGNLPTAEDYSRKALAHQERLAPGSLALATTLFNLGDVAAQQSETDKAQDYFSRSLSIRQKLAPGSTQEAQSHYALAKLNEHRSPLSASASFERTIDTLESQITALGGSHDTRADFRAKYAEYYQRYLRFLLRQGDSNQAFAILERSRARTLLEMLAERDLLFVSDIPAELDEARRRLAVTYDRIQQQIAQLDPGSQLAEIDSLLNNLEEVRRQFEQNTAAIRKTSPKFSALQYPKPLNTQEARATLDQETVALYYSVSGEATHLFVLEPNEPLQVHKIAADADALRDEIRLFRELIRDTYTLALEDPNREALLRVGERLMDRLIGPALSRVAQAKRLLIVPDGPLHSLPWSALVYNPAPSSTTDVSQASWQFLVEWKPVHVAISATVYKELRDSTPEPTTSPPDEQAPLLVAFGDPSYPIDLSADVTLEPHLKAFATRSVRFTPLPGTRREVEEIAEQYGKRAQVYLGAGASEENAKNIERKSQYVHFASHVALDERVPLNSAVVLAIPDSWAQGQENGLLQTWEILEDVRLEADLVVLSGCESGLGKEVRGEGLMGLTRAFHYAGAKSVLASLWKVPDSSTAELMVRIYKQLSEGKTKDEALRAAQLDLIRRPVDLTDSNGRPLEGDSSSPYGWAAFQVFGSWE